MNSGNGRKRSCSQKEEIMSRWFKPHKSEINSTTKEHCFCTSRGDMLEHINKGRVTHVLKRPLFYNNFEKFHFMDISRNCSESTNNDGLSSVHGIGIEVHPLTSGTKTIFKHRDFQIVFHSDFGWKYPSPS